ncbi:unnamed protein product [Durusdinium trenchii]|uniref:Alpha-ketoglutarate-dependent dioxygenase AlkB-like domain-containing protein n=1 Tax=Durusdinium trenchii TaxID=1381693 RepID=A0ABP0RRN0_9DINO
MLIKSWRCWQTTSGRSTCFMESGRASISRDTTRWTRNSLGASSSERNLAIIKHYKSGKDCMGEHSDAASIAHMPVASLSAGAARRIIFRANAEGKRRGVRMKPLKLWMEHGDVLVMVGKEFQSLMTHELPRDEGVKSGRVGVVLRARELVPEASSTFPRKRQRAVSTDKSGRRKGNKTVTERRGALLASREAEERSQRRAAAIRDVLQSIRCAVQSSAKWCEAGLVPIGHVEVIFVEVEMVEECTCSAFKEAF